MNVVPLDGSWVRGTHGRLPDSVDDSPLLLCSDPDLAVLGRGRRHRSGGAGARPGAPGGRHRGADARRRGVRAMSTTLADEQVVLVDHDGTPIGTMDKSRVHTTDTPLHLAFSCYAFDSEGRMLLTRRSLEKRTWPGVLDQHLLRTSRPRREPRGRDPAPDAVRTRRRGRIPAARAARIPLPRGRPRRDRRERGVPGVLRPAALRPAAGRPTR